MQRQNFESGVLRIAYIAWLLSCIAGLFFLVEVFQVTINPGAFEMLGIASVFLAFVLGPWFVIRLIRWVYRGFVPMN